MLFRYNSLIRGLRLRDTNSVTISELRNKERYVLLLRTLTDDDTIRGREPNDHLSIATLEADLEICTLLAGGADALAVREQGFEVLRMLGEFTERSLRLLLWRTGSPEPSDPIRLSLSLHGLRPARHGSRWIEEYR